MEVPTSFSMDKVILINSEIWAKPSYRRPDNSAIVEVYRGITQYLKIAFNQIAFTNCQEEKAVTTQLYSLVVNEAKTGFIAEGRPEL